MVKLLRALPDSVIDYVADRLYDRIKAHVLKDLQPHLGVIASISNRSI